MRTASLSNSFADYEIGRVLKVINEKMPDALVNCEFKENTYHYFLAETDSLSMERIKFENCLLDGEKM